MAIQRRRVIQSSESEFDPNSDDEESVVNELVNVNGNESTPSTSAYPSPKSKRSKKASTSANISTSRKQQSVPQAEAAIVIQVSSSPRALDRNDTEDVSMVCPPAESSRTVVAPCKTQERSSRSVIREKMARRLSVIAPKLVNKKHYETRKASSLAWLDEVPETQDAEDDARFPEELPSSDSQVSTDIEIDMERSRAMAQEFREKLEAGMKPDAVIPRLGCIHSQGSC